MQLGTMVHTGMVENALAGRMEPDWGLPKDVDPRAHFQQVHRDAHEQGPAANLAQLRERLPAYDAALAQATDEDLDKPAWFYGLPDSTLRRPIAAYTNDLIVHGSDIRRAVGLEPWFSPGGSQFAGPFILQYLPMFVTAERLAGATGVVRQIVDGVSSIAVLGPEGVQIELGDSKNGAAGVADATIATDGGTWALLTWRQLPPAEAERLGRLQITGDRDLVERYLGAIKTA
jgi:hypothetical protein